MMNSFRHYQPIKRHIIPDLNQHCESLNIVKNKEDAVSFYTPFPYKFENTIPIFSPFISQNGLKRFDPVLELPRKKHLWKLKKKVLIGRFQVAMKTKKNVAQTVNEIKSNPEDIPTLQPRILANVAYHLSKNPDKHFKGLYNWYYGNAATLLTRNGKTYLLSPVDENLDKLGILCTKIRKSRTSKEYNHPRIRLNMKISLKYSEPIYNIVTKKNSEIIGIRQKDACYLMYLNSNEENETFDIESASVNSRTCPFVSLDVNDNELCTVSADRTLKIWTPEYSKKCIVQKKIPSTNNKNISNLFLTAKYKIDDCNTIVAIDGSSFLLYDKRTGFEEPSSAWHLNNHTECYEEASLLLPSFNSNYWYIGLTNSLFLLDIRCGVQQKWTHMLQYPPTIGCIHTITNNNRCEELLTITSQGQSDVVSIYNDWSNGTPFSNCLPRRVPNRTDTLLSSRVNGVCLDPAINIRFQQSIIGMVSYRKKKQLGVFTSTASGDIFHQRIKTVENFDEIEGKASLKEADLEYLSQWEADCLERLNITELHHTDIANMSDVFHKIDVENVDVENLNVLERNWKKSIFQSSWNIPKKELLSYKDFLASHIIEDFDIEEELDSESELSSGSDLLIDHGQNKVESWLSNGLIKESPIETDVSELFQIKDDVTSLSSDDISLSLSE